MRTFIQAEPLFVSKNGKKFKLLTQSAELLQQKRDVIKLKEPATHGVQFPPLDTVTRPIISTAAAAYYLNRRPQTIRAWAYHENGNIRLVRINARLAWPVASIRTLIRGE